MSSEAMEVRDAAGSYVLKAEQDVPPGYKRTEVGVIPEDWKCVTIDKIAQVKGGKRLPAGYALTDAPTPHPYIRVSDMRPGGVDLAEIKYVPDGAFPTIQNYRIYESDIFISVAGTLGIVGVIPPQLNGANLTENADRLTDLQCDRDYLKYWMMSSPIQKAIDAIRTVGAQPKLALGRIAKFTIAIPSKRVEQRAIATALSDVDALITALDKLIAKKRAIKTAAMQQLLTGKTRLPGFSGEWETKRLGDLADMSSGGTPSTDNPNYYGGDIRWVSISDMTNTGKYIEETEKRLTNDGLSNSAAQVFPKGAVLYAMYASIGECSIAKADMATSQAILGIRAREGRLHNEYLYYYLVSIKNRVKALGQQGTQANLNKGMVQGLMLRVPPINEQTAIAQVLSDMDAEIAALEVRRDKTRAIKQGMMQQLLTGRVRLVKPNSRETA